MRICETVTFLPKKVTFPEIQLVDFLQQAATDIITILTQPPSITTPSLQAGNPICNALLDLATNLNCVQQLPTLPSKTQENQVSSPRVELTSNQPPRVCPQQLTNSESTSLCNLLQHSKLPANNRFNNTTLHHYNLWSRKVINHVYNQGKKETIDTACNGKKQRHLATQS